MNNLRVFQEGKDTRCDGRNSLGFNLISSLGSERRVDGLRYRIQLDDKTGVISQDLSPVLGTHQNT